MSAHVDLGSQRMLAAIMFTDIAGYTALMQADEENAMRALTVYRKALLSAVENHNGELLQHIGDGSLTMFNSAVEAVRCAIALQRALRDQQPVVAMRAGIHLGDIVIEPDSVYGDGVNVASRIEQLADPGSVLVSQAIFDSIRSHRKFKLKYLGVPKLRNVLAPTPVYAVRNSGLVVPDRLTRRISIDLRSLGNVGLALGICIAVATTLYTVSETSGNNTTAEEVMLDPILNHTGSEELNNIGQLAMNYMQRELTRSALVKVRDPVDHRRKKAITLRTAYYKDGEMLTFQAMLLSGKSDQIEVVFDPQTCLVGNPEECIAELTDQILGYWSRGAKQLSSRPPGRAAFETYRKAMEVVPFNPDSALSLLKSSIDLDPEFIEPRLACIRACVLSEDYQQAQEVIDLLKTNNTLSAGDRATVRSWESLFAGNPMEAFEILDTIDEEYATRTQLHLWQAVLALRYLREPRTALQIIGPVIESGGLSQDCGPEALYLYQETLIHLNRYDQAEATLRLIQENANPMLLRHIVRAMCTLEHYPAVYTLLSECERRRCDPASLAIWAATQSLLVGDTVASRRFASAGLARPQVSRETEAALNFLAGHYSSAAALFDRCTEATVDHADLLDLRVQSAIAKIMASDTSTAEHLIRELSLPAKETDHGKRSYLLARLYVATGEREMALIALDRAISEGIPMTVGRFDTDIFLLRLFRENRFQRMTEALD